MPVDNESYMATDAPRRVGNCFECGADLTVVCLRCNPLVTEPPPPPPGDMVLVPREARKAKYTAPPQDPMDMLAEEGLEVAHERMKAIRFGWEGVPEWRARGIGTPRTRFIQEVGDFLVALDHALAQGKILPAEIAAAKERKHARLLDLFGLEKPILPTQEGTVG